MIDIDPDFRLIPFSQYWALRSTCIDKYYGQSVVELCFNFDNLLERHVITTDKDFTLVPMIVI